MHKSSLLTLLSFFACATGKPARGLFENAGAGPSHPFVGAVARCGTCTDGPWTICTSQVNYLKNTANLLCDQATYDAKVKCYIDAGCWDGPIRMHPARAGSSFSRILPTPPYSGTYRRFLADPAYTARNQMVFQQLRDSKCTGVSATGVVSGDPTNPPGGGSGGSSSTVVVNGATGVVSGDPTFPPGGVSGGSSSTVVINGAGAGMLGMNQAAQDLMKCVASPTGAMPVCLLFFRHRVLVTMAACLLQRPRTL